MQLRTTIIAAALVLAATSSQTVSGCAKSDMEAYKTGTVTVISSCAFIGAIDDSPVALELESPYSVHDGAIFGPGGDLIAISGKQVRVRGVSLTSAGCLGGMALGGATGMSVSEITVI